MAQPQIIEEQTVTTVELKEGLDKIQERDEEVSFRAGKTVDHLNHIPIAEGDAARDLIKAIEDLEVPRLKPHHVHKIVDIMPRTVKELNVILSGYTLTVNKDYQQQIIDTING